MYFDDVVDILNNAVGGSEVEVPGPHGAFWRDTTRDDFIENKVKGLPLIKKLDDGKFDGKNSNLVLALKGWAPFGKDLGVPEANFRRMPAGRDGVKADSIRDIEEWINNGCPDSTT